MSKVPFTAVILAAGKGSRMLSERPKVMQMLADKSLITHIVEKLIKVGATKVCVVCGYQSELLKKHLAPFTIEWIYQPEPLGTGHAVKLAVESQRAKGCSEDIVTIYGDTPLISIESLHGLLQEKREATLAFLTAEVSDPTGYGRVIRKNDKVIDIIEEKDCTEQERKINEINSGVFVANIKELTIWLNKINNKNNQKEYYLTDVIAVASAEGASIKAIKVKEQMELQGVNDFEQLALSERYYQLQCAKKLAKEKGVRFQDMARFDLRGNLECGKEVNIDINVLIEGNVTLGDRVTIGAGCIIRDSVIQSDCIIKPFSIITEAMIKEHCIIGPFAHLRPNTLLNNHVKIGNFVEIKASEIGSFSKAGHLAYLGNTIMGEHVNVGAGAIICNYDGIKKHTTTIGNNVFLGSNSALIAPINIAENAVVAAGTTVTKSVLKDELVIGRVRQKQIKNYKK